MTRERIISIVNYFLLGLILVLIMSPSWADSTHKCQGNACNGDTILTGGDVTNTLTGGDVSNVLTGGSNAVSVGGNRSYGVSLGDVDINDCLASTQWGIPVIFAKQKVQENPWCMANSLDAMGAHAAAAKLRCTTKSIKAIYPDAEECERAVMFHVKPPDEPKKVDRDDEDWREALSAFKIDLEEQRTIDADNVRKYRVQAQRVAQSVQIPDDTTTRRAMARAALKGEE